MGKEIDITGEALKKVIRCKKIVINSEYQQPQTITHEYEELITIDGVPVGKGKQCAVYNYSIDELMGITINVNGRDITGLDVATFFFIFNDNRETYLSQ